MMIKSLSKIGWIKAVGMSALVMVVVASGMSIIHENSHKEKDEEKGEIVEAFSLIDREIEIEYGEILSMNPHDYVKEHAEGVINAIQVDLYKVMENGTSIEKVDLCDEVLDVGAYYLVFTYKAEKQEVKVKIVDTQAPLIILKKQEIELQYGEKWNARDYVNSVKDMVDGELEYTFEGEVNTKKAGTYIVNYKAVDKNGCESTEELKVVVHDKKESTKTEEVFPKEEKVNPEDGKVDPDYDNKAGSSGDSKADVSKEKETLKPWTVDEVPAERKGDGDIAFTTKNEALEWANKQISDENSKWYGCKFMVSQIQKYGQQRLPNDPWAVTFILIN